MFEFEWWIAAIALFVGCTVQTAVGFGMAVVAAPIIVVFKPEWVPYVLAVMALAISFTNAWYQRSDIAWKDMIAPFLTRLPGTVLGTWLLIVIPVAILQMTVAGMVFLTLVVSLWLKPFPATPKNLGIAGFVSGVTGTTTSIGGPPLALVMQHSAGKTARANLSAYFVYSCIISLFGYYLAGLMPLSTWYISASFLPFAFVGFFLGKKLQRWVDNRFRPILLWLCGVSAVFAFSNAIVNY